MGHVGKLGQRAFFYIVWLWQKGDGELSCLASTQQSPPHFTLRKAANIIGDHSHPVILSRVRVRFRFRVTVSFRVRVRIRVYLDGTQNKVFHCILAWQYTNANKLNPNIRKIEIIKIEYRKCEIQDWLWQTEIIDSSRNPLHGYYSCSIYLLSELFWSCWR